MNAAVMMITGSDAGESPSFSTSEIVHFIIALTRPACNDFAQGNDLFRSMKSVRDASVAGAPVSTRGTAAVSHETMTYRDLLELVELIKSTSQFGEFHVKLGDLEVDLKRGTAGGAMPPNVATPGAAARASEAEAAQARTPLAQPNNAVAGAGALAPEPASRQRHGHVGGGEIVAAEPVTPEPGAAPDLHPTPLAFPPGAVLIKSPMVGMFYRASEPGARAFVEVGQQVEADTTVCIIEVMKLMNSISAGHKGTVTHILVGDSEPVEYGQVLMVVDPA